jgi:hypothetical protein
MMTQHRYFTGNDTWHGGFYELAMELGERSDERLLAALSAVWSHPDIAGFYSNRDIEPYQQEQIAITDALQFDQVYGVARLPNDIKVACGTFSVRLEDGNDWLDFYVPFGALATAYPVGGYPFEADATTSRQWRDTLNKWLSEIGTWIFALVPYRLGLVGFEVSGELEADDIIRSGIHHHSQTGLLWPENGQLIYYPDTE